VKITINGRTFRLLFTHRGIPKTDDGNCDQPADPPGVSTIRIRPNLTRERKREVLIHELLHAARWSMSESQVTCIAADIATVLKENGF
jgi:hypothetical protein